MMALFTETTKKKRNAEALLDEKISDYEWCLAHQHAQFPGWSKPVEKIKHSRARFNKKVVAEFLGFTNENYMQNHAYGDKDYKTATGKLVQMDAVSTTATSRRIIEEYKGSCRKAPPRTDGQCDKRDNKSPTSYCCLEKGHKGRCKFTESNMLSASSVEMILARLTKGALKNRAGLDDEDVEKGAKSIERLIEIFEVIASEVELNEEQCRHMKKRIDKVLSFHKAEFRGHLKREAERPCQCVSCGFHSIKEPSQCSYRNSKTVPCSNCDESFKVYSDLVKHADNAIKKMKTAREKEKFKELRLEIIKCRENLIDWRSHMVRKKAESEYFTEQQKNIKKNQAVIVCDFKMKILPIYFLEGQRQWFGKRGTACLGFMVLTNIDELEDEVDADFFFFFCDDTTQDSNFVLSAKSYIYSEFLPSLFPDDVTVETFWQCDGAGCFNSTLMKACQPYWYKWTGGHVEEKEIGHNEAGDGKTKLDGLFAILGKNLNESVRNRDTDIIDAATCLLAFQKGAGIKGATGALLTINREKDLAVVDRANGPILRSSHRLILDRDRQQIMCYSVSGYGKGTPVSFQSIYDMWATPSPEKPEFHVTEQAETVKSREQSVHSTESWNCRKKRKKVSKRVANEQKMNENHAKRIKAAKDGGLFLCDVRRRFDGACCKCQFLTQKALDRHKTDKAHNWGSMNMCDTAAFLASGENGVLQVGSRCNRNEEHKDSLVVDGSSVGREFGKEWFAPGCYRKTKCERKRLSDELKIQLTRMFEAGENSTGSMKNRNKYTVEKALQELRDMRLPSGLLKFSDSSDHGKLPTTRQIKSFWSRYRSKKRLENEKNASNSIPVDQLDEWVADSLDHSKELLGDDSIGIAYGNVHADPMHSKVFVLDGCFKEVGGDDVVKKLIESKGGKVHAKAKASVSASESFASC